MLSSLFSLANKDGLEELAKEWAKEPRNMALLSDVDNEFTLESAIDFIRKLSKYVIGSDTRIAYDDHNVSIVIRHSLGENFSFFFSLNILNFRDLLPLVRVHATHNNNTVFIRFEKL